MTNLEHLIQRIDRAMPDSRAVRVIVGAWAALTAIHLAIWTLSCAIGGHVDTPWWLFVGAATVPVPVASWWLATPHRERLMAGSPGA